MTIRPLQNQVNDIAVFVLSIAILGFVTRMVRDVATDATADAKAPALLPATTKEPWQMTREEWLVDVGYKKSQGSRVRENWLGTHEGEVRVAVQNRKPVPSEVLKDYPDMKPPQTSRLPQTQKTYREQAHLIIEDLQKAVDETKKADSVRRIERILDRIDTEILDRELITGLDDLQDAIEDYKGIEKSGLTPEEYQEEKEAAFEATAEAVDGLDIDDDALEEIEEPKVKQPDLKELFEAREFHRLTRNEMLRLAREATLREGFTWDKASEERIGRLHKRTVETAVREGVPVPEAVLRDYPELRLPQGQRKDIDILDRLIQDKQRDTRPSPSLSDARKAVYKDILNGFGTVQEVKDYVEGMPEDSVLFTTRGNEISFTLIKLIITDIERNPWLSPFRSERPQDISWQPPLMPETHKQFQVGDFIYDILMPKKRGEIIEIRKHVYIIDAEHMGKAMIDFRDARPISEKFITLSFQGDTTFKPGEIVSEQTFRAENERVMKLGLRPARGWSVSKGVLLSWRNGWRPIEELEEYLPASIPRDDLTRIADKYGWWAAKLAQSVCPHNDVACVEREARRLAEARRARLEE